MVGSSKNGRLCRNMKKKNSSTHPHILRFPRKLDRQTLNNRRQREIWQFSLWSLWCEPSGSAERGAAPSPCRRRLQLRPHSGSAGTLRGRRGGPTPQLYREAGRRCAVWTRLTKQQHHTSQTDCGWQTEGGRMEVARDRGVRSEPLQVETKQRVSVCLPERNFQRNVTDYRWHLQLEHLLWSHC